MLLRRTAPSPAGQSALGAARFPRLLATLLATAVAVLPVAGLSAAPATAAESPAAQAPAAQAPAAEAPAAEAPASPEVQPVPNDGPWTVEAAGQNTWRVRWTAPGRLPASSDRPTITVAEGSDADLELSAPTVTEDGRTVAATVVSEGVPDPDQLDVVLSGRVLDDPADEPAAGRAARWPAPDRELLDVDPARPGPHETRSDDYTLPAIRLAGMAQPVEMAGHVVEPVERDGSRPLVLLLHGRHGWCFNPTTAAMGWRWPCARGEQPVPSHRGYRYLQQLLASQGYVTVSVSANGVNAQDGELADAGAAARSRLVRAHLDRWAGWVADGTRAADLGRVVLVGHSRGGEGVARATLDIPLSAPYRIAGQALLAPTDFSRQSTPYVPAVTLLPYCDGDVVDLQGQAFTDVGRDVAADDTALKSSVLVMGANHNYFNTEWTPGTATAPAEDDSWLGGECARTSAARLTATEQRAVAAAYVAGAVHLFAAGDERVRPLYDGSAVRLASTGDSVVLSHALGGRVLRRPGTEVTASAAGGAVARICTGVTGGGTGTDCGRFASASVEAPHWPTTDPPAPSARAFELTWSRAAQLGTLGFAGAPLDLTGAASLDLRTVVEPRLGDVTLTVRVRDQQGRAADVGRTLRALPPAPEVFRGRYWAQPLRVDTAELTAAGLDTTRITAVDLVGRSARGRVWVLDVAARPATPPPVPERRVAVVDLGQVRVAEGDRTRAVAQVPYAVRGSLTAPATVRVYGVDPTTGAVRAHDVRIPAGATSGTIPWPYTGNRLDSVPRKVHLLYGYGVRNAMAADYLGHADVRDDDPSPRVTFRAVARTVQEGRRAVWRYALSAPVDYPLAVQLVPVRGTGTAVRVNDLDRAWARDWVWSSRPDQPLHQAETGYFELMRPGRTSMTLSIPTRRDGVREGPETVTVQARTSEPTRVTGRAAVTVAASR